MNPTFFATPAEFRKWLTKNHKKETELLVGFYKIGSKIQSISWSQSVDEALCFGWIDGIRKSIGKNSYSIRFTPRKTTSIWSAINIKKVELLTKQGLMQPAGFEIYEKRKEHKSRVYSYEQKPIELSSEFTRIFKANSKAWLYFTSQAPSYQKTAIHLVMSAKQESTRLKRLHELINDSEQNKKIKQLSYSSKKNL